MVIGVRTARRAAFVLTLSACAQGIEIPPDSRTRRDARVASEQDASEPGEADDLDAGPKEDEEASDSQETTSQDDAGAQQGDAAGRRDADLDARRAENDAALDAADATAKPVDAADADAGCASCALKVQWNTSTPEVGTPAISGNLKLMNTGAAAVALTDVTVRYWLREPAAEDMIVECYYGEDGRNGNLCVRPNGAAPNTYSGLSARVGSGAGDLRYVELSFPAGTLAPSGATPIVLQLSLHLPGYVTLAQSDDPSFDPALGADAGGTFLDAPKITAYVAGALAWGSEP